MAKADLGTKRICPVTGRKFYDLNKTPVVSPYTGEIVPIAPVPTRSRPAERAAAKEEETTVAPETTDAEFVSLEDAEAEQQGKKKATAEGGEESDDEAGGDEADDTLFIEEEEEGSADVTDIVGDVDKEEEA